MSNQHPNKRKFKVPANAEGIDPKSIFYSYGTALEIDKNKQTIPVRYAICGIYTDNTYTIGVARCSPKDKYVKAVGRELSLARAVESPVKITMPTKTPGRNFREIAYLFANPKMNSITKQNKTPENANLTIERPVVAVPVTEEFSESQIH
mgnify:FL=1